MKIEILSGAEALEKYGIKKLYGRPVIAAYHYGNHPEMARGVITGLGENDAGIAFIFAFKHPVKGSVEEIGVFLEEKFTLFSDDLAHLIVPGAEEIQEKLLEIAEASFNQYCIDQACGHAPDRWLDD